MHFKKYFLLYTLIPLLILSTAASYFRFMVIHDYTVEYEGSCEPEGSSCFIGCGDEECKVEYYYTIVTKNASHLFEQCGTDITDCELANICLPEDNEDCNITYCDPLIDPDACETIEGETILKYNESIPIFDNPTDGDSVTELSI